MKVKISGLLEYTPTSIEESWIAAYTEAGYEKIKEDDEKPRPVDSCDEPIIEIHAEKGRFYTEYQRWIDRKVSYEGMFTLENVAKYINDPVHMWECVGFYDGEKCSSGFSLKYENENLTGIGTFGESLVEFMNRIGMPVDEERDYTYDKLLKILSHSLPSGTTTSAFMGLVIAATERHALAGD